MHTSAAFIWYWSVLLWHEWTLLCAISLVCLMNIINELLFVLWALAFTASLLSCCCFFVLSLYTVGFSQADICAHWMPFLNIYITADRIHIHGLFRIIQYSTAIWTPCRGLLVTVLKMSWCHFYRYRADKQFVFWGCYNSLMLICSCFLIFSQPSIYIDGWLYAMRMTSVVCNVPVLSQNDSTYRYSVLTTWKWHPFATWTPRFIILV